MVNGASFDFTDVMRLAAQFDDVVTELPRGTRKAAIVSAVGVKKSWRQSLNASDVPASGSTINYEVTADAGRVEAVVEASRGTDRLRGYVYAREYGSPTVAPAGDGQAALQANVADFERGIAIAGQRAIKRALNR